MPEEWISPSANRMLTSMRFESLWMMVIGRSLDEVAFTGKGEAELKRAGPLKAGAGDAGDVTVLVSHPKRDWRQNLFLAPICEEKSSSGLIRAGCDILHDNVFKTEQQTPCAIRGSPWTTKMSLQ